VTRIAWAIDQPPGPRQSKAAATAPSDLSGRRLERPFAEPSMASSSSGFSATTACPPHLHPIGAATTRRRKGFLLGRGGLLVRCRDGLAVKRLDDCSGTNEPYSRTLAITADATGSSWCPQTPVTRFSAPGILYSALVACPPRRDRVDSLKRRRVWLTCTLAPGRYDLSPDRPSGLKTSVVGSEARPIPCCWSPSFDSGLDVFSCTSTPFSKPLWGASRT
jgi:hypothetical protein